ncbi:Hint domain-containing protein [Paracoccus saliphilus]|uniref:Hint domain-containing protein n=1 Tax=Paracoccus saliphilus TaxID=405559 RepID=A0AA45W742_9RHOB|nr:Hint domain-containing protein [Paracoccus saliphilus]WCR03897.1 Hint domain-containing protein [Paracoccus saliphilus]SIT06591.1 Hint domain-containing protein [Paracoccus saliphilus]
MTEYTFWAIRENAITWGYKDPLSDGNGDPDGFAPGSSFTINDTSQFFQVTVSDDDLYLNQYADFDTTQIWIGPDVALNPTYPNDRYAASLAYKTIDAFPGGGIYKFGSTAVDNDYGFITFSGLQPGDIKEGVTYSITSVGPYGTYTDDGNGRAPRIAYSDLYGYDQPFICFTANTLIETDHGNKPVEELQIGDMIATMDDGYQPIRWIGSTSRDAIDIARNPKLRPIRIPAGALGGGLPKRDLMVSRQHRVLVKSKIAQRMFGADEVLIPANKLVGVNGIEIAEDIDNVTYFHILFDKHQVIFSEDAPTESLFTGPEALKSVSPAARQEIETLFPQITAPDFIAEPARLIPAKGSAVKKLVARHVKHATPLL